MSTTIAYVPEAPSGNVTTMTPYIERLMKKDGLLKRRGG